MRLVLSKEVQRALKNKLPIVSLESTIISHGLPYPRNIEMATSVESLLRDEGVTPATCAFINGVAKVGLDKEDLTVLTNGAVKVSRRDIGYVMANKLNGGTTIASTMILSHLAGIKIFATGGLGGVHRNGENTMDVSADLTELGKTPVSVVCAGPKAILDIGLTMEYLETQGVFVGTYKNKMVPGFYTDNSGVKSPYVFHSYKEAADIITHSLSGNVFCIPPPRNLEVNIDDVIKDAPVSGKELTPYLLGEIAKRTKGESVNVNIELVKNNVKAAAKIAKEYYKNRNEEPESDVGYMPVVNNISESKPDVTVVGSVAIDTYAKLNTTKFHDSNIGEIKQSVGGVGYNIAKAASYICKSKLISRISKEHAHKVDVDSSLANGKTAQYISTHDAKGDLIIACADMSSIEEDLDVDTNSDIVVFDCNLSPTTLNKMDQSKTNIIEPTSHIKAKRIGMADLHVFPNNQVKLITPTISELDAIYSSMKHKFDIDNWFPVLDSINPDYNKLDPKLLQLGVFQQCFSLLPFFQNIIVKLGKEGVLLVSLCSQEKYQSDIPKYSKKFGNAVVEYFPIPKENENINIVNVTGAGDTFVGYLAGKLSENNWLKPNLSSSLVAAKYDAINKAQLASGLTLQCEKSVNEEIATL